MSAIAEKARRLHRGIYFGRAWAILRRRNWRGFSVIPQEIFDGTLASQVGYMAHCDCRLEPQGNWG